MRLVDVGPDTRATFLRCLHDEAPDDPRVIDLRRARYEAQRAKGLRARVLVLDSGEVAALCQTSPIESTHLIGRDLLSILCIWVHGYDHHIGNQQGNGYGRHILETIEDDARESGFAGVTAWGMDFPYWNPVSFYEHMGYERVDTQGLAVLVWKPWRTGATRPRFRHHLRRPQGDPNKVSVYVFLHGWCTGACSQCVTAREAVEELGDVVEYREFDTSDLATLETWGISDGIYVDGEPHRPYEPPCTSDVLRQDILAIARTRGLWRS